MATFTHQRAGGSSMRPIRTLRRKPQQGQILVIVAGGLIGLLAIAAFALEGGTLVLNRRDSQNAADLSALAGARVVAQNYTEGGRTVGQVYSAIDDAINKNDCGPSASAPCTWDAEFVSSGLSASGAVTNSGSAVPNGAIGVRVSVTREPSAIMGRILGFDTWEVSAAGTAVAGKSPSVAGGTMLPIALCGFGTNGINDCERATGSNTIDFVPGQVYDITDGKDAPGGFGWLTWTGSNSATTLNGSVCVPDNPPFSLDSVTDPPGDWDKGTIIGTNPADGETWFPAGNGKMNSSGMRACLDKWINSGATVLIPIYDIQSSHPNGDRLAYHIVGLAAFILTSREQPAVDQIQGTFVKYYPLGDVPGGSGWEAPSATDTTTFIGLVQ